MPNAMLECPKCHLVLNIKEEGDGVYYVCSNCGYRVPFPNWVHHDCRKCGCDKAELMFYGIVRGDEVPLTMYKCVRCGTVEREGFA